MMIINSAVFIIGALILSIASSIPFLVRTLTLDSIQLCICEKYQFFIVFCSMLVDFWSDWQLERPLLRNALI